MYDQRSDSEKLADEIEQIYITDQLANLKELARDIYRADGHPYAKEYVRLKLAWKFDNLRGYEMFLDELADLKPA